MVSVDLIEPEAPTRPPIPAPVPDSPEEETVYPIRRADVQAGEWAAAAVPESVPIRHYQLLQSPQDLGPRSERDLEDRRSYALELTEHERQEEAKR